MNRRRTDIHTRSNSTSAGRSVCHLASDRSSTRNEPKAVTPFNAAEIAHSLLSRTADSISRYSRKSADSHSSGTTASAR